MSRLSLAAAAAALFAFAPASALAADATFEGELEGVSVARHEVAVSPGTTWTFKLKAKGDAPHLFVSTDAAFRPHDATCADDSRCTVDVETADKLYVFVMSDEGALDYRLKGRVAASTAQR